jgi:hypothetical protein
MELNALKRFGVARLKLVDISKESDIDSDLWDAHLIHLAIKSSVVWRF